MRGFRPLTRLEWQFAAGMAILIWCACAPPPRPTPLDFSGTWAGTTSQGRAIAFTVTPDLRLTSVTIEYAFGTCFGTVNIPGDAPLANPSGTASAVIVYTGRGITDPGRTVVNFLFPSITNANGTAQFVDVPTCGGSTATWTATKR